MASVVASGRCRCCDARHAAVVVVVVVQVASARAVGGVVVDRACVVVVVCACVCVCCGAFVSVVGGAVRMEAEASVGATRVLPMRFALLRKETANAYAQ